MNIRHLRIFIAVVDCGNMHKAARQLFISQPSVSQAISEIEKQYGVQLFERLSKKLYLTDTGRSFLSYARHIVQSFDKMEQEMRKRMLTPKLYLGGSVTVGTCLLHTIIARMEQEIPGLDVYAIVNNTSEIEAMLLNNELDAAIVEGSVYNSDLLSIPMYQDELVIVAGKGHPLFEKENLFVEELEGTSYISRESGSAGRNQYEQFFEEQGIHFVRKWCCTNTEAIKNAVIHGRGIAALSRMIVDQEVASGQMKILSLNGVQITRTIKLIYHKNKYLSQTLKGLISLCQLG